MDARAMFTRGIRTGLRLGRGTADRVVGVAGPPLGRLTDQVAARVWRPEPRGTTTTFVPTRKPDQVPTGPETVDTPAEPTGPSPASVARNIAPQRPTAKPVRAAKPKSAPGAKLPPRPSTT